MEANSTEGEVGRTKWKGGRRGALTLAFWGVGWGLRRQFKTQGGVKVSAKRWRWAEQEPGLALPLTGGRIECPLHSLSSATY